MVERGQAERVLAALAADLDGLGYHLTLDEALLKRWSGLAFRHVPTADPAAVLDTQPSALRGVGRWHSSG